MRGFEIIRNLAYLIYIAIRCIYYVHVYEVTFGESTIDKIV